MIQPSRLFFFCRSLFLHTPHPETFGANDLPYALSKRCTVNIIDFPRIIIHTANMIHFDWSNMTQAIWRSPLLPLLSGSPLPQRNSNAPPRAGTGAKFKLDLLAYLHEYGNQRTGELIRQ